MRKRPKKTRKRRWRRDRDVLRRTNREIRARAELAGRTMTDVRAEYTAFVNDVEGRGLVKVFPELQLTVMRRALDSFGVPTEYLDNPVGEKLYTTVEGADLAATLRAAHEMFSTTFMGLARRFRRHPDVLHEFGALLKLDAKKDVLKPVLERLWRRDGSS